MLKGNISEKIKDIAHALMLLGIAGSVMGGLVMIVDTEALIPGIATIVLGTLFSYVGALLLCGFAEHIKQLTRIANNTQKDAGWSDAEIAPQQEAMHTVQKKLTQLEDLYRQGAINDEDYQHMITAAENGEL